MRFVGVDLSLSRTGLCIIDENGGVVASSIKPNQGLGILDKQLSICRQIAHALQLDDIVCIEEFGVSSRFSPSGRFIERVEMIGMLKVLVPGKTAAPVFGCPVNRLKQFLAGKASAEKDAMLRAAQVQWGAPVKNHDEADAFGLAKIMQAAMLDQPVVGKQRTALEEFKKYGMNSVFMRRARFVQGVAAEKCN